MVAKAGTLWFLPPLPDEPERVLAPELETIDAVAVPSLCLSFFENEKNEVLVDVVEAGGEGIAVAGGGATGGAVNGSVFQC